MSNFNTKRLSSGSWVAPSGVTRVILSINNINNNILQGSQISGGGSNTLILTTTNEVLSIGNNTAGNLGDGSNIVRSQPTQVSGGHTFTNVLFGLGSHALALKANGEAWSWGFNNSGQLGVNDVITRNVPTQVVGAHSFTSVATGTVHSLALKANGEVWAWGAGSNGILGVNDTAARSTPTQVIGGHSFTSISATAHSAALKANGEAWGWGLNTTGQLGVNDILSKSTPTQVVGGHSFISIATGGSHTLALKANGEVWSWGSNGSGQLGVNDLTPNRSSPVQVLGGHSFTSVVASSASTFALKANGEIWGWGANTNGILGINSIAGQSTPVQVLGGHSFTSISAGGTHVVALKASGEVWVWGTNTSGQLGLGDNINRSMPVQISLYNSQSSFLINANKMRVYNVTPNTSYNVTVTDNVVRWDGIVIGIGSDLDIMWVI